MLENNPSFLEWFDSLNLCKGSDMSVIKLETNGEFRSVISLMLEAYSLGLHKSQTKKRPN